MDDKLFEQLCEGLRQTAAVMRGEMEPAHIWYHTEEKEIFEVTMADLEALRFKYGERPYTGKQIRDVKGDRNG